MARYYVDTAVFRDYHEGREDRFRPLGEWALAFFKKALMHDELFASLIVVEELRNYDYSQELADDLFMTFRVRLVPLEPGLFSRARHLARERSVPKAVAAHALLARKIGAVLVSRDKDFLELLDIVDVRKPEELL